MSRNRILSESDSEMETEASSPPTSREATPEPERPRMVDYSVYVTLKKNDELQQELREMRITLNRYISLQEENQAAAKRKKPDASSSSDEGKPAAKKPAPQETRPESSVPSTSRQPSQDTALPQDTARPSEPETAAQAQPKAPAVPPVILRKKEKWIEVSSRLKAKGVNFSKAKLTGQGVAITPQTPDDYRKMTRTFNEDSTEYHTFSLPEDRTLRLVIRGIPEGVENEQVRQELLEQNFNVISIHRMTSRRTRQPLPLLLVQVPQHQTGLLEVNRCCGLVVRVDRQRKSTEPTQCHRCQRFGHAQSMCRAAAKCVKCGQDHHSKDCRKTKDTPAKCANCNGDHPASSSARAGRRQPGYPG